MRIGPERETIDKEPQLQELTSQGYGLSGCEPTDAVNEKELYDFVKMHLQRFGIAIPEDETINTVASDVFYAIDVLDPYVMICGICDVVYTDDWNLYAYELDDGDHHFDEIHSVEWLETFRYIPGQDMINANTILTITEEDKANPEFSVLRDKLDIWGVGDLIQDVLSGDCFVEHIFERSPDIRKDVYRIAGKNKPQTILEIIAWLSFGWMIGPSAREWRRSVNPILDACYDYGECILYSGNVFTPQHYKKQLRPPRSCCICNLDSYCVELSFIEGGAKYVCEYHLSGNIPNSTMFQCGTRICRYMECHHHPEHGKGTNLINFYRQHGQLNKMTIPSEQMIEYQERKMISNV